MKNGEERPARDYAALVARARGAAPGGAVVSGEARGAAMRRAADELWEALSPTGVSWIGFYVYDAGAPAGAELVLGPRRDKPACSPIGLHGCCGRAFVEKRALVVRDVRSLGAGYIACDPRDLSEVVVPLFEADGTCWGVLDADSFRPAAFDASDAAGLEAYARALGLSGAAGGAVLIL